MTLSHDRRRRQTADRDDWVLPPWNPPSSEESHARTPRRPLYETPPPRPAVVAVGSPVSPRESGFVLGMGAAPAIVGALALAASFVPALTGGGNVPRGLMLLIVVQASVVALLKMADYGHLVRIWFSTLVCSAVLLPLLALQVTLLREPYVSWGRGSASPAMVATLVVAMVLIVGAVWSIATSWNEPDQAGLIFLPQAMVVPALIGVRSTILESPALRIFGQIMLLAGAAIAIAWLLSPMARLLTPPIAVAIEFVVLWATGYGPWFHVSSGNVVRVLYGVMLALTIVLVAAVPFIALWVKHDAHIVRQARQRPKRSKGPSPPTSRTPIVPRGR